METEALNGARFGVEKLTRQLIEASWLGNRPSTWRCETWPVTLLAPCAPSNPVIPSQGSARRRPVAPQWGIAQVRSNLIDQR
jgi:hypothetical protein